MEGRKERERDFHSDRLRYKGPIEEQAGTVRTGVEMITEHMEINEEQADESKQRLFIPSLLYSKRVYYCHLCLGRNPKAGTRVRKL